MLDSADVDLAVELGELADGAADGALTAVAEHTGAVMAQLDAWDGHDAVPVASVDCPPAVSRVLSVDLPSDAVFGRHLLRAAAPCLTDDPPHDFRRSPLFAEHLAPAGVATGLSMALRTRSGRLTGLLHLAGDRVGHFDERHRDLLAALAPVLARTVDRRPVPAVLVPAGFAVTHVPATCASPNGMDPTVADLARRFAARDAPYLRFLRPTPNGWDEVRLVREPGPPSGVLVATRPATSVRGLTPRELEVLTAVATGATNQQIAAALVISLRTVATHVENLLGKLAVANRTGAAVTATRDGLLLPSPDPASPRSIDRLLGAV